jgi:hypothetical protein
VRNHHDDSCSPHQIPKSLVQIKHSTQSARPAPQPVKFDPTRTIQAPKGQAEGIRALVEVRSIVCPRDVDECKRYCSHNRCTKNTTYEGGHCVIRGLCNLKVSYWILACVRVEQKPCAPVKAAACPPADQKVESRGPCGACHENVLLSQVKSKFVKSSCTFSFLSHTFLHKHTHAYVYFCVYVSDGFVQIAADFPTATVIV